MLATTLLPHQTACIERILDIQHAERDQERSGVVVSLLWGSGKTLTSIEAALAIRNQCTERLPILVFTDVSTIEDWTKNAHEHYSPSLSVTFVGGKARVDSSAATMNWHTLRRQDIIVTNVEILVNFYTLVYNRRVQLIEKVLSADTVDDQRKATLRAFLENEGAQLNQSIPDAALAKQEMCTPTTDARFALFYTHWPVIIIDEAHKVRNASSAWFFALSQLRDSFRISLTATPFNNSIEDVISVLSVSNVAPPSRRTARRHLSMLDEWTDVRTNIEDFCADFTTARDTYIIQGGEGAVVGRLHYCPVDIILRVPFDSELERTHYDYTAKCDPDNALKSAVRLKQTCSGVYEKEGAVLGMEDVLPTKVRAVLTYLDVAVARGEKVNILCEFRYSLEQLRRHINAHFGRRVPVYTVDGETSARDRQAIRQSYERQRGAAVLIATSVFNQGVNLHCANHTILFSTQWNPVVTDQGRSRCERPAQTRSVFSVQIVIADTIEDRIWAVASAKRKMNVEVMTGAITPELLSRVDSQDEDRVSIDAQLERVDVDVVRSMRDNCTHYIDTIDSIAEMVPRTTAITAITAGNKVGVKRMNHVGVVEQGRVVFRRID